MSTKNVNDENSLNERISRVFEFAIKLSKIRYPQFMDYLQDDLATLRYRLCELDRQKKNALDILIKKELTLMKRQVPFYHGKLKRFFILKNITLGDVSTQFTKPKMV